jgi:hypothetical protein
MEGTFNTAVYPNVIRFEHLQYNLEIDSIVSTLITKKRMLESQERQLQLELLETFLQRSKKETEEVGSCWLDNRLRLTAL